MAARYYQCILLLNALLKFMHSHKHRSCVSHGVEKVALFACGLWGRYSGNNQQELWQTSASLMGAFCLLICCKKDDTLFQFS
jgi:hypothetical protein